MAELHGDRVVLRPVVEGDVELQLVAIRSKAEVMSWWGPTDDGFPLRADPEATRFTIRVEGQVAG